MAVSDAYDCQLTAALDDDVARDLSIIMHNLQNTLRNFEIAHAQFANI